MRRIHARVVVPLATGALLLAACSAGGSSGQSTSAGTASGAKDTLTLGATADMYGWDPANQPGYQNWAGEAVWDNLARCNAKGELEPDLAASWEITNGNKTFVAHLRDGVTFSDGSVLTPDAVQASFEYTKNGGSAKDYADLTYSSSDAHTISITWPDPQPVMANKICSVRITPKAFLDAKNWNAPVGSGPYVLDTANTTTGSVYTFTKNQKYWDAANYPYKTLVIKVIKSDTAAVSALKTGQVDASLINLNSVKEAEASNLKVIKFQGQTPRLIISDHQGKVVPALGDVRVRQAMNMVFDKKAMADKLYGGNAEPTAQVFRKGTAAYIDNLSDPYPFNIDAAKKLMSDAGFSNGFDLQLPTMEGQNFETLMPYVKQQLALINIRVTEVPLSGANAIGDLLSGKYPVVLWQLGNLGNSALQIYIEATPKGWWDLEHQPDQYVDSRWDQIATADQATSTKLQQEINKYIVEQAWFAPFVYMGNSYAYNPNKVSVPTESDQEALTPKLRDFK